MKNILYYGRYIFDIEDRGYYHENGSKCFLPEDCKGNLFGCFYPKNGGKTLYFRNEKELEILVKNNIL